MADEEGRQGRCRAARARPSRCTTCVRLPAPRPPRPAWVVVRAPRARPPVVAPRAPRPATRFRSASRVAPMPLHMRLPKLRGFKNPFRVEYQVVNLDKLAALFPEGGDVTVADLVAKGAVRDNFPVKVLGTGEITVKVNVTARQVLGVRQGEDRGRRRLGHAPPDRTRTTGYAAGSPLTVSSRHTPLPSDVTSDARGSRSLGLPDRHHRDGRAGPRHQEDLCSPPSPVRSGRRTCAGSCCSRSAIIVIFRLGSHVPVPGVSYTRRAGLHQGQPTRPTGCSAWPTCSAAARCSSCRSSRSGSCRTSRRASSCSCSPWSSRGSRPSRRRASRARRS